MRSAIGLALCALAATASVMPAEAAPVPASAPLARVLVLWEDEANPAAVDRLGARVEHSGADGYGVLAVEQGRATYVAAALRARPDVRTAEPDTAVAADEAAGRPMQWGLHNRGHRVGDVVPVSDVDLDAPEAWRTTVGRGAVVALLDTGVDVAHPDLAASLWTNAGEVVGNGLDDDANGYVDDVHGWDFRSRDATVFDASDGEQHGTQMAGLIAGRAGSSVGASGVAPASALMVLKVLGPDGGLLSDVLEATSYAIAMGADVVSMSFGGTEGSELHRRLIEDHPQVAFVASAGNTGRDNDAAPRYPSGYGLRNLLSVTAVDAAGALPSFSSTGERSVDVGAPGRDVLTTSRVPAGGHALASGTSAAAALASGVAALASAASPGLSGEAVLDRLRDTAVPLPSLQSRTSTGALLNAHGAVGGDVSRCDEAPDRDTDGVLDPCDPLDDVDVDSPYAGALTELVEGGITAGCGADVDVLLVCPDQAATRSQAAALSGRASGRQLSAQTCAGTIFSDVCHEPVLGSWVERMAAEGLVQGCGDGRFCSGDPLPRGELASVLRPAFGHLPVTAPTGRFLDVPATSTRAGDVERLAALGVTAGCGSRSYCPLRSVTRGELALMLVRLTRLSR